MSTRFYTPSLYNVHFSICYDPQINVLKIIQNAIKCHGIHTSYIVWVSKYMNKINSIIKRKSVSFLFFCIHLVARTPDSHTAPHARNICVVVWSGFRTTLSKIRWTSGIGKSANFRFDWHFVKCYRLLLFGQSISCECIASRNTWIKSNYGHNITVFIVKCTVSTRLRARSH